MKYFLIFLTTFSFLFVACGSQEQPAPEPTLSAQLTKTTPEYVEYQWVEVSLEEEGFLVLIDDETAELSVFEIVHEVEDAGVRYQVINTANGQQQCETTKWTNGGGGASKNAIATCGFDLTATMYGDWHLGSGNTVNATVIYSVFLPLNKDTADMVVSIDGPEGENTLITITNDKTVSATWGDIVVCERVSDGTNSRSNPATSCGVDENLGYGVIIFGHHDSVKVFD